MKKKQEGIPILNIKHSIRTSRERYNSKNPKGNDESGTIENNSVCYKQYRKRDIGYALCFFHCYIKVIYTCQTQ